MCVQLKATSLPTAGTPDSLIPSANTGPGETVSLAGSVLLRFPSLPKQTALLALTAQPPGPHCPQGPAPIWLPQKCYGSGVSFRTLPSHAPKQRRLHSHR